MNKLIVAFALCVSVLVFAIEATARPGPGDGPDGGDMVGRMSEHLDLSVDQQEQITTIVNTAHLEGAVDQERKRQIEKELRGLAENFDAGSAQALADELGEIAGRLAYSRVYTMSQVREILTEEQIAQRQEQRESFSGHRRGGSHEKQDSFLENNE
jgi:Spy/CpxP family protein refolding chaperone